MPPLAPGPERTCGFCGRPPSLCPSPGPWCTDVWRADGVVPVVAAVLEREGQVLLCLRPPGKRHGGLWEFPGGKLFRGETLGEAARRGLAEELGLRLTGLGSHLGSRRDPGSPFEIHFVEVTAAGDPRSLEHEALAWVALEEVLAYPLAPGDRSFAEAWTAARRA